VNQTLTIPVARAIRDTEEGFLDLSAVREGLITIEADGSFKDTEKLITLLNALGSQMDPLLVKLRAEGLDTKEASKLEDHRAAIGARHVTSLVMEGLAEMLPIAARIQCTNLVDSIEDQMESSSDYLVDTVRQIEALLAD
jgi:hypothetical protein